MSWIRNPGEGKYATLEYERRFLLRELPAQAHSPLLIEDRYIIGTRMRLRRVEADGQVVFKFCQKIRPQPTEAYVPTPPPIVTEVTGDDRYSGGHLAGLRGGATVDPEIPSRPDADQGAVSGR